MSKERKPREKIPASQVLDWLKSNWSSLWDHAVLDRAWVWIAFDLSDPKYKDLRDSLKEYGFRFAKRGHALPDGRTGWWGHACMRPMPFKRKGGSGGKDGRQENQQEPEPAKDEELMALLSGN